MSGKHHYQVLTNAYHKDHLMEQGRKNGVNWEESDHEGVNWMRFSHALTKHLDEGGEYDLDDTDPAILQNMLDSYTNLREMHKQSMIPHIRACMSKLHADKNDANLRPIDLLEEAHKHLSANGGHMWAEKLSTLSGLNKQISKLQTKLQNIQPPSQK